MSASNGRLTTLTSRLVSAIACSTRSVLRGETCNRERPMRKNRETTDRSGGHHFPKPPFGLEMPVYPSTGLGPLLLLLMT